MSIWFKASSFFMAAYLVLQSIEDTKTKTVYAAANNLAIVLMAVLYLAKCTVIGAFPSLMVPAFVCLFLLTHRLFFKKLMGIGDAKAYAAIILQSGLCYGKSASFLLAFPVAVYLLTSFLFSLFVIGRGIVKRKKIGEVLFSKERVAYFPFLFFGYMGALLLSGAM